MMDDGREFSMVASGPLFAPLAAADVRNAAICPTTPQSIPRGTRLADAPRARGPTGTNQDKCATRIPTHDPSASLLHPRSRPRPTLIDSRPDHDEGPDGLYLLAG